jgi:hypothetical protein
MGDFFAGLLEIWGWWKAKTSAPLIFAWLVAFGFAGFVIYSLVRAIIGAV